MFLSYTPIVFTVAPCGATKKIKPYPYPRRTTKESHEQSPLQKNPTNNRHYRTLNKKRSERGGRLAVRCTTVGIPPNKSPTSGRCISTSFQPILLTKVSLESSFQALSNALLGLNFGALCEELQGFERGPFSPQRNERRC